MRADFSSFWRRESGGWGARGCRTVAGSTDRSKAGLQRGGTSCAVRGGRHIRTEFARPAVPGRDGQKQRAHKRRLHSFHHAARTYSFGSAHVGMVFVVCTSGGAPPSRTGRLGGGGGGGGGGSAGGLLFMVKPVQSATEMEAVSDAAAEAEVANSRRLAHLAGSAGVVAVVVAVVLEGSAFEDFRNRCVDNEMMAWRPIRRTPTARMRNAIL